MTRVKILTDGERRTLTARDHAGDIEACNYITGVLYALAGFIANEAEQGRAVLRHMVMEPGAVTIDAKGGERLEAAFEMACVGLLQLQETRPEAIQVEIGDRKKIFQNC